MQRDISLKSFYGKPCIFARIVEICVTRNSSRLRNAALAVIAPDRRKKLELELLATNIYVRTSTFLESTRFGFSFTFLAKFVGRKFLSNNERSRARIKAIHIEEEKFAFDIRFVRLIAHVLMNRAFRNDSVYRVFRGRT